ncbi:uncharacterized protein LOC128234979 isoform X2 [Mya arenaria]|uniref:uncharacterized protein LOC128234979 isoform X2 n=1 Tax=Mya arenaria TaxID=6604 RepID=UPI0022E53944|nr:uncharacterized protein LOC128234979 isoform X2 [Mya arenaria]
MGHTFFIFKDVYILFLLPCLNCEVCGTLRLLNPEQINRGDDVQLEFSNIYKSHNTSLVTWWKDNQTKPNRINTTLQRFHIDVQQARVTLTISNVTAADRGNYTASLGSIQCSPPRNIFVTVKELKIFSIIPQFPDNVTIPELDCERCLVGTVGVYMNVECIVSGISKKYPKMEFKIKKNGQDVPNVTVEGSPLYRAFYGYTPSEDDTDHTVACEATRDGQKPETVLMTVIILRKPSIPTITLPDSIKEGKHAHISCQTFNARPGPRLYFMYNSSSYNTSNIYSKAKGDKTVDAETILEKSFSRYDNTRSLECCVEFKEYHKNTQNLKTYFSTSAISILFPPKSLQLEELWRTNDAEGNTSLRLQCISDVSNPVSEIRWNIEKD